MFCPNCGTANDDTQAKCQKCGFALRGESSPRFKGTMMMMNAPPGAKEALKQAEAARRPSEPPRPGPAANGAAAGGAMASAAPMRSNFARPRSQLKATMMGVAPPPMPAQPVPEPPRTVELPEDPAVSTRRPAVSPEASGPLADAEAAPAATEASTPPVSDQNEGVAEAAAEVSPADSANGTVAEVPSSQPEVAEPQTGAEEPAAADAEPSAVPDRPVDDLEAALGDKPYTAAQVFLFFATCGLYGVFRALRRMMG